jgi:hypothetical protein
MLSMRASEGDEPEALARDAEAIRSEDRLVMQLRT